MKKEEKTSKIKKKKEEKYKLVDTERLKKVELIISLDQITVLLVPAEYNSKCTVFSKLPPAVTV